MSDMNVGTNANITSLAEEGGLGGWYKNQEPSPTIFSPARKQTRRSDVEDVVEDGFRKWRCHWMPHKLEHRRQAG